MLFNNRVHAVLPFLCLLFLATIAYAQPPQTILVQGQLLDSGGAPLNGNRDYLIRFYDASTVGTQLGGDITGQTIVSAEGLFAIPLVPPAAVLGAAQSWYELSLDSAPVPNGVDANDVFPDRIEVHSVPFAQVAGKAMNVDVSAIGDGSVTQTELSALSGVTANIQTQIDTKANATDVYIQSVVDSMLALKADAADVYTKTEVDNALNLKANSTDLFQWQVVTASTVQAEANRGYILNGTAPIWVTLPLSASLTIGDIIRVSGMGTGGWRLLQNAGQQMLIQTLQIPDYSGTWMPRFIDRSWSGVASSADGTKLVAVTSNSNIYTSTDAGVNWTSRDSARTWKGVASSVDGAKLVAVDGAPGYIYTSIDSGATWTPRDSLRAWTAVASSADGSVLVAVDNAPGQIYTSTDSGVTWTPRDSNRAWSCVASSADGTKMVAGVNGEQIYTSTDAGVTWTPRDSNRSWRSVTSSSDGSKLAAIGGTQMYTSADYGLTWVPRDNSKNWRDVDSSSDGTKLVAVVNSGNIYTSTNSGLNWIARESTRFWAHSAISSDGAKLVAAESNQKLYTYSTYSSVLTQTTVGTGGSMSGPQHSAVELQYIGINTFIPLSYVGDLGAL